MKLAELQQLSTKELKELAAKEGVTPSGDKRIRITWLEALEQYFKHKEILNYQPKHYQAKQTEEGECFYRRRDVSSYWRHWAGSWLLLKVHLRELDRHLNQLMWEAALAEFRLDCFLVAASPRPP